MTNQKLDELIAKDWISTQGGNLINSFIELFPGSALTAAQISTLRRTNSSIPRIKDIWYYTPDEKVNIATVQKFWDFLVETLKNIPVK